MRRIEIILGELERLTRGLNLAQLAQETAFMVRKLENRFRNVLTMNIVFRSPVIAGSHATYDDKIQFLAHF